MEVERVNCFTYAFHKPTHPMKQWFPTTTPGTKNTPETFMECSNERNKFKVKSWMIPQITGAFIQFYY